MSNFLSANYEVPQAQSKYFKLNQGANKFRVVSSAIVGYEYWNSDNKPVRLRENPDQKPQDIREDSKIKHFWAFVVIDRKDQSIKVMEVTQSSIMLAMKAIIDNEDWGNPQDYDLTIVRTGEKLETEYTVQPSPHKMLTSEEMIAVKETKVNLEALFDGGDPFSESVDISKV